MNIPWVIGEQTKVKHNILENYIKTWSTILYKQQEKYNLKKELIYFDGFSGPGIYYKDNTKLETIDGSPIIVGKIANDFIDKDNNKEFTIFCIDEDKKCLDILKKELKKNNKHNQFWEVSDGTFDDTINDFITFIHKENIILSPTFFFIDPFGYSGIPINTLKRILEIDRSEILLNFMIYDIVRAVSDPKKENTLNNLFGCEDYKKIHQYKDPEKRQLFLKNLYIDQLKKITKAKFITPFRVNTPTQGDRPRYYLIHCTNHYVAMKEMKNAMFKNSESEYALEAINIEKDLFTFFENIDFENEILAFLKDNNNLILYEEIEKWCYINTCGVSKTIKKALLSLEKNNKIEIIRLERQKSNTVTNGAKIKVC